MDEQTNGQKDEWTNRQTNNSGRNIKQDIILEFTDNLLSVCVGCHASVYCRLAAGWAGLKVTKRVRPGRGGAVGRVPLPQPGFPPVSLPAQTGRHMITWPDTGHC